MNINFNLTDKGKGLVLSGLMLLGTIFPAVAQEAAQGAPESDTTNTSIISTPKTTISYNIAPSEDYGYLMPTIRWAGMGSTERGAVSRFEIEGEGLRARDLLVALSNVLAFKGNMSQGQVDLLQQDLDSIGKLWRRGIVGNIEIYKGTTPFYIISGKPTAYDRLAFRLVDMNGMPLTEYYQNVPDDAEFADAKSKAIHEYIQEALAAIQGR
jgi:hypothetical protein